MQVYNLYHEGKKTTVDTSIIIIKISRENHRRASHSYRPSFKDAWRYFAITCPLKDEEENTNLNIILHCCSWNRYRD